MTNNEAAIIRRCYELIRGPFGERYRDWFRNGGREDPLIPVRIVAVRLVSCELTTMSSCLNDGAYSSDERRRIAALVEQVARELLDGSREVPESLPIPATGVHRHRSEPRRTKADEELRFADTGVHRVREFVYDKRTLRLRELLTDVD